MGRKQCDVTANRHRTSRRFIILNCALTCDEPQYCLVAELHDPGAYANHDANYVLSWLYAHDLEVMNRLCNALDDYIAKWIAANDGAIPKMDCFIFLEQMAEMLNADPLCRQREEFNDFRVSWWCS